MPLVAIKNKLKRKWQIFNIAFKLYTIHLKDESQQMPTTKIFYLRRCNCTNYVFW